MSAPSSARESTRVRVMTVVAAVAAVGGVLLVVGFAFDIAPLDLWTYPVAAVLAVVAITAAIRARVHGLRVLRAGGAFTGAGSLAALGAGIIVLFLTFFPSLSFLFAQLR